MESTYFYWAPSSVSQSESIALTVLMHKSEPMTKRLHRELMENKLLTLVDRQTEEQVLSLLEMSAEHLPELYAMAQEQPSQESIAELIMTSDTMGALIRKIQWDKEPGKQKSQLQLERRYKSQSLHSLLERL